MINTIIILCAKYLVVLAPAIVLYYAWKADMGERKHLALFALISFPLTYVVAKIGSMLYYDPRPFVVTQVPPLITHLADNGFPSDHALILGAFAALFLFFNKKVSLVLWAIAFAVSLARVLAGVHHVIDVVASMVIALAVTSLVYVCFKLWKPDILPR